jgi:two-component system, sensor histidine kinase and response regulator
MNLELIKILLIDNFERKIPISFLIESLGYSIIESDSAEGGIEVLKTKQIDLVIMDVGLNQMGNATLMGKIKNNPETNEIPVIIISPFSESMEIKVAQCIKQGADDIVTPFILETLIASKIAAVLEKKSLRDKEKAFLNEIEEKNKSLEELNQLKNKFVGMAAHDLRNPLSSIRGFSEILLEERHELEEEDQEKYLNIINSVSTNMLKLVNDILDVSVIESGKLDLACKKCSLKNLIGERIQMHELIAEKKGIKLSSKLQDLDEFKFDPDRITQVFDNILSNAIKFSPSDKNIFIDLKKEDGMARVIVKDEGPGISPEDQKKLFKDFQKLSARPTGGESSTGLGLAIVKKMVDAHQGALFVESVLGEGAAFNFKIPLEMKDE